MSDAAQEIIEGLASADVSRVREKKKKNPKVLRGMVALCTTGCGGGAEGYYPRLC